MKVIKKISETVVKQDKNQRNYKTVGFSTLDKVSIPGIGDVFLKPRTSALNLYEKSYINDKEDFGYNLPMSSFVQGSIETRTVEAYQMPDTSKNALPGATRTVNTFTCVVLGDTDSPNWENQVIQEMTRKGHKIATTTPVLQEESYIP